jgi:hypothetical protein
VFTNKIEMENDEYVYMNNFVKLFALNTLSPNVPTNKSYMENT